jgi:hypothetical protein
MGAVRGKIFGMKKNRHHFKRVIFGCGFSDSKLKIKGGKLFFAGAVLFFALVSNERAEQQQIPIGKATDFTSDQYFEPPNDKQIKMRLAGASSLSLPNGAMKISHLKIETFYPSGKREAVVNAPECIYSYMDGVASSAGHLELQASDGKIRVTGDGFLWRQSDNSLTISNHVHTVIQTGILKLNTP